jgi:hypothetical protein
MADDAATRNLQRTSSIFTGWNGAGGMSKRRQVSATLQSLVSYNDHAKRLPTQAKYE